MLAARLAGKAALDARAQRDAFYLALMRYAGCTADSDIATHVLGDEVAVRGGLFGVDWGSAGEFLPRLLRAVARGKGVLGGTRAIAHTLATMPQLMDTARSHCEVAERLSQSLGFDDAFRAALGQIFERWDGRGWPHKLRGAAVAVTTRVALVADEAAVGYALGGVAAVRERLPKLAKRALDPSLVACGVEHAEEICAPLAGPSIWAAALEAEPPPVRTVDEAGADAALQAIAHFTDMKSRFTRGHSTGVARLARAAAARLELGAATERLVERAGWLHDLGRVAVSAGVWDKPGPLSDLEWERVRTHTYVGERILARAEGLAAIAEVATQAHERLDGHGYHRRLAGPACVSAGRVLAAADVYVAMTEARAHRPAHGAARAAAELTALAQKGSLCAEAVAGVLAAAGHAALARPQRPSGLTEREVEVVRLVARGLTNKEVASALGMSTKTAGHHLQHVFAKLGVTTRAGATMVAMQSGLV